MNEPPKIKFVKALIIILVSCIIIFIGVVVSAGDLKTFRYFTQVGGCGMVFGIVKFSFDNWERMVWEEDDSDDDE